MRTPDTPLVELVFRKSAWQHYWTQATYATVQVRSDSLAALGAARRLSSSDARLNSIMQELSLQVAVYGLNLGLLAHTPGLANKLPDALSRKFQAAGWQLPEQLRSCRERTVPPRLASWWLARNGPAHYK